MFKRIVLILICLFFTVNAGFSKDIPLTIRPVSKITTSNLKLQNGDSVEFLIAEDVKIDSKMEFKKGQKVYGTITSREENGFMNEVSNIYIENFYTKDRGGKRIKLKGIVYKEGRSHDMINGFLPLICILIRGGEVQINSEKNTFTIYWEEN
ncbi:MAG: hypothetical protein WCY19_03105 [Candidatus Gastranaerophilaceae bacterium]